MTLKFSLFSLLQHDVHCTNDIFFFHKFPHVEEGPMEEGIETSLVVV